MEKSILTPRLKLTLIESVDSGSDELKWAHAVRSNEQATTWSIHGVSKDLTSTQAFIREHALPAPSDAEGNTEYRTIYAIHKLLETSPSKGSYEATASEIIGLIALHPEDGVPINKDFAVKSDLDAGILKLEIGYLFLPTAWGNGYATETVVALLEACERSKEHFAPYSKLYVQAVVGLSNPGSIRVMEKARMKKIGMNKWDGERAFLGGGWQEPAVWVYGTWIFE